MLRENLLQALVTYLSDGKHHCIRIYGHGASGKSRFAMDLYHLLEQSQVNLLETDPYIISGEYRDLVTVKDCPDQKVTACLPLAHELSSLKRDIIALSSGMDILTIDEPWAPSQRLSGQKPILLIEGMSAAFLSEYLFDLSICFYTDDETELARRLARDTSIRKRHPEWIKVTHKARRKQYENYYKPYQEAADLLICQSGDDFILEKQSSLPDELGNLL